MNRSNLMKIHSLLAAFMLPVTLMFAITGVLYTWGIKGGYSNTIYEVNLNQPLQSDRKSLHALIVSELEGRDISVPEGKPKLKVYGSHFLLEWTGSSKDVILEPTTNSRVAKLTIKDTSWYRTLVQLHKAKGGAAFKVYVSLFTIALATLLLSGFVMAMQIPKLRTATLVSSLVGCLSFIVFVFIG